MKIFLVEDSLVVRGQLAAMLATIPGAEVVGEAASALPAIRDILNLRPDLVLLDVHLAEGSGFEVLNAVHVAAPEIDFCMLTDLRTPFLPAARRAARGTRGFRQAHGIRARARPGRAARRRRAGARGPTLTPIKETSMKIQVQCRRSGEPRTFLLGARWLHVISVLDRVADNSMRRFRLLVADGREFVLRHDPHSGDWQLARVHARRRDS